jgi:hypothetical protein
MRMFRRTTLAAAGIFVLAAGCIAGDDEPAVVSGAAERSVDELMLGIADRAPDFGGMFVGADGRLNVYTLGGGGVLSPQVRDSLVGVLGSARMAGGIQVLGGQYGFGQLKQWQFAMTGLFDVDGVVSTDVDESTNRVRVGVETADLIPAIEAQLAGLGVPREAALIEVAEPIFQLATLRDQARPLAGGLQVHFSNYLCTYGFNAVRAGVSGFVTNSHCTTVQGGVESTQYFQPTSTIDPVAIGSEIADPVYAKEKCPTSVRGKICRNSDSAFVAHAEGASATLGALHKTDAVNNGSLTIAGAFNIVGEAAALKGETVNKVGRTTGWSQGTVSATCVDTGVSRTKIVQLCQTHVSAAVGSGDSGSPVFKLVPGSDDVSLSGILWGGNNAGSSLVFSPLANIQRSDELGTLTVR